MIRRGFVHLARMPGETKRRPVLVLSPDRRNELAYDVSVVPCSSVARLGPWHVVLRKGVGGLDRASVAKCEQVTTLPKATLDDLALGGPVPETTLSQIRAALLRALGWEE